MAAQGDVTQWLVAWGEGDRAALDKIVRLVHDDLRKIARKARRSERVDHTLQTTALVNEVYLRLATAGKLDYRDRGHFYATAARLVRQVLVDYARRRCSIKRGGGAPRISLDDAWPATAECSEDLLALDEALQSLSELDDRKARIVELRFFSGLTVEETARRLQVSAETIRRDWRLARAWLRRFLSDEAPHGP